VTAGDLLRSLHRPGDPLVLVNVWDVATARAVAAVPGMRAIATASWSIAASLGVADGEVLPRDEMLAVVGRIARAVDLPVTADLERGYGASAPVVGETVAAAVRAGAAGCNVEDSLADGSLRPLADQVSRLSAARASGGDIVLNARTDALACGRSLDEAIVRGRAYLAAGADCVFVLAASLPDIPALVDALGLVSVLARGGGPSIREWAEAGVARVSVGPGGMGVALAELSTVASILLAGGAAPEQLAFRPS
jgi:2-methylisocitrate lyase-like PEP mutase family enzyme